MSDAALLNLVLFLPLVGIARCSRYPRASDGLRAAAVALA